MSWDIFVQDVPSEAMRVADIPSDYRPSLIGKRSEIIHAIIDVIPTADFSDPSWGLIDGEDWSIEVNLGQKDDRYCDPSAAEPSGARLPNRRILRSG